MDTKTNLRDMKIDTGSGKDVRDTQKLSGEASPTPAQKAKNSTVQYETGSTKMGSLGGENTGS